MMNPTENADTISTGQVATPRLVISKKDKARMNNKFLQFFRFVVLNLRILKAVDHSKRS